ncbi:hypothetical protein Pst134EA_031654 [Puccinia striiformis f. sp. tritici]|uniref:Secreted protein n=1 Tax=Puccinia striiformis f. sp. tritici PST-78 TaxID=1165861 RepID=A0A0L0VFE9_9BASI|nr:uncharacterized protein Pst134EA_031654 [Puccinia striiformis f. sp. tritici]KAH9442685.1 hypothetical protein Pst134EA_031654 [Puccinia striiformis f. sp. tritici]KNE97739.1 hypothetical protein PSTG_08958 [Puccinia striiformis f. sp. tritici PST-78]
MRATTSAIFLAISLSAVKATVHTVCYNHFLQKDGCVFSAAAADQRCPAPPKEHPAEVQAFALNSTAQKVKRSVNKLERRYDTTAPSFAIGGGNGTCGFYDSVNQLGVCLWNGAEQNNPTIETAGWLNGAKTSNCGKRIYIQRKGQPNTVQFVKVLDGCYFGATSPDPGCFDIGLTIKLFNAFNPTPEEQRDGVIKGGITWDFDNLHGLSPQQAPV